MNRCATIKHRSCTTTAADVFDSLQCMIAGFFLKKFRGGMCDLNDLPSLDSELYENLRKLKHNPVSELNLSIT